MSLMRRHEGGFRRVDEIAASAGAQLPRHGRGRHLVALAAWRSAVGKRLDRSTRFAHLAGGVMTVDVAGPEWRDTLSRWSPEILERVRRRLGAEAPRQLELRIRPGLWRPAERVSPAGTPTRGLPGEGDLLPAIPSAVGRAAESNPFPAALEESQAPGQDRGAALQRIAGRYLAAIASRRSGSVS
jgi:hypothetical protein